MRNDCHFKSESAMQIYEATRLTHISFSSRRISRELMKRLRRELIENLLFNKETDRVVVVAEVLPAKQSPYENGTMWYILVNEITSKSS